MWVAEDGQAKGPGVVTKLAGVELISQIVPFISSISHDKQRRCVRAFYTESKGSCGPNDSSYLQTIHHSAIGTSQGNWLSSPSLLAVKVASPFARAAC